MAFRSTQILLAVIVLAGFGLIIFSNQMVFFLSVVQLAFMLWVCQFVGNEYLWGTFRSQIALGGLTRQKLWLVKTGIIAFVGSLVSLALFTGTTIIRALPFDWALLGEILLSVLLYGYFGLFISVITRSISLANTLSIMLFFFDYFLYLLLPVFSRLEQFQNGEAGVLSTLWYLYLQISMRSNVMNGMERTFFSIERGLLGIFILLILEVTIGGWVFFNQEMSYG